VVIQQQEGGMEAGRGEDQSRRRAVRIAGIGLVVALAAGSVLAAGPAGGRGGYGGGTGTPTPTPTQTATPTATATATATPTATPVAHDTTAPSDNSRVGRGQTARSILKRGLLLNIVCNENCRHATKVFVGKQQARKLGIKRKAKKRVLVGKRTTLLQADVAKNIRVKLNRKAKRGIRRMKRRHVRKLKLTIGISVSDAANNVSRSASTLSFKR
jgi:hypothetical protein